MTDDDYIEVDLDSAEAMALRDELPLLCGDPPNVVMIGAPGDRYQCPQECTFVEWAYGEPFPGDEVMDLVEGEGTRESQ